MIKITNINFNSKEPKEITSNYFFLAFWGIFIGWLLGFLIFLIAIVVTYLEVNDYLIPVACIFGVFIYTYLFYFLAKILSKR